MGKLGRGVAIAPLLIHILPDLVFFAGEVRNLFEALDGLLAVEERGGLLKGEVLRLENFEVDKHDLECQPDDAHNLQKQGSAWRPR